MTEKKKNLSAVANVMRAYADRGVFRDLHIESLRYGKTRYRFGWLAEAPFTLIEDPARSTLTFKDLLPGIPPRSRMDRDLRTFLQTLADPERREHRRIDPERVTLRARNRSGSISIILQYQQKHVEYAALRGIHLVSEIVQNFLMGPYQEYMVEQFNLPEE